MDSSDIRTPAYQASAFSAWLRNLDDSLHAAIFSVYLDLIWLEPLCEAISHLDANAYIRINRRTERTIIDSITQKHVELFQDTDDLQPFTVRGIGKVIYRCRRNLEKMALSGSPPLMEQIIGQYPLGQVGHLGRSISGDLLQLCKQKETSPDEIWRTKVCMDESECLIPFQQRIVNTMVRLSTSTLSYVISYVRTTEDSTSTLIPNISLQLADREVIPLDQMTDQAFSQFADGVAKIRIAYCSEDKISEFRTIDVLGELDINALLSSMLQSSENKDARTLLELAARLEELYRSLDDDDIPRNRRDPLPIYQAYIIDHCCPKQDRLGQGGVENKGVAARKLDFPG